MVLVTSISEINSCNLATRWTNLLSTAMLLVVRICERIVPRLKGKTRQPDNWDREKSKHCLVGEENAKC